MGLEEVRRAAEALRDAEDNRAAAMAAALGEGETVADVARAARVTRQTVYRLTAEAMDRPGRSDLAVLTAGIDALLELELPPHTWAELMKARSIKVRRRGDMLSIARRVQLGIRSAPRMTGQRPSQELQDALIVAGRLLTPHPAETE